MYPFLFPAYRYQINYHSYFYVSHHCYLIIPLRLKDKVVVHFERSKKIPLDNCEYSLVPASSNCEGNKFLTMAVVNGAMRGFRSIQPVITDGTGPSRGWNGSKHAPPPEPDYSDHRWFPEA
jgi:hypothetical protein